MKVIMNGEEYNKGVADFMGVYYKDFIRGKSFKDLITVLVISLSLLIVICFASGDTKTAFTLIGLALGGSVLIILTILIVGYFAKKRKYNITKVEYNFEDKIYATSYIGENSTNKEQYNYESVSKIVESKEYFYLFVSKYSALVVKKSIDLNREEFIEFMIGKNIAVKEYK